MKPNLDLQALPHAVTLVELHVVASKAPAISLDRWEELLAVVVAAAVDNFTYPTFVSFPRLTISIHQ